MNKNRSLSHWIYRLSLLGSLLWSFKSRFVSVIILHSSQLTGQLPSICTCLFGQIIHTFPPPCRFFFVISNVVRKLFFSNVFLTHLPLGLRFVRGDDQATPVRPLRSYPVHRRAALLLEGRPGARWTMCALLRWISTKCDRLSRALL